MDGKNPMKQLLVFMLLIAPLSFAQVSDPHNVFVTSEQCIACHSNMTDDQGNDISIGHSWRSTMMALSAKDPYWMAGVRRESIDHPTAVDAIEDTCSVCHMPMARTLSAARGEGGKIFSHLDGTFPIPEETAIGADGVSCTVCHQIQPDNFGEHSSFDGGYIIDTTQSSARQIYGPFEVDHGLDRVMQSASNYLPGESSHVQESELCATCHTLITKGLDGNGNAVGDFAEQMPYLEWRHSDYRETDSCQDCHMPELPGENRVSSVLGEAREEVSEHGFRGGNAFMLGLFSKYREELNVGTPREELDAAVARTKEHLARKTANVGIDALQFGGSEISFDVVVENIAGHKLPTAYPSRRVWLHVQVTDQNGDVVFESGAPQADGSIAGNDNDASGTAWEPHYDEITSADQVQIYEPVIHDFRGEVTTSLLSAVSYAKDNRIPPRGFDKATASWEVAVHGGAAEDDDFASGSDTVSYRIDAGDDVEAVSVFVRLYFQPIGYRWAMNLRKYDAFETNRFVGYYEDNSADSMTLLAEAFAARD